MDKNFHIAKKGFIDPHRIVLKEAFDENDKFINIFFEGFLNKAYYENIFKIFSTDAKKDKEKRLSNYNSFFRELGLWTNSKITYYAITARDLGNKIRKYRKESFTNCSF
jgi:hypothetical protein